MMFTPVGRATWFARAVVGLGFAFLSIVWSRRTLSKAVQAREAVKELASPAVFEALWDRPDLHRCFYDGVADSNRYRKLVLDFDDEYAIPTATPGQEEHSRNQ